MKVAIYCRTSVDDDKTTIESQLSELPTYAKKQQWTVTDIYKDTGLSGAYIEGRPEFIRLLNDMESHKFDMLLVSEFSRVTRIEDLEERGKVLGRLQRNNIILVSPTEGEQDINTFTGELMAGIQASISAEEKRKISSRMKRGKREKLRKGQYCLPNICYGLTKEKEINGKEINYLIKFEKNEYKVLRQVYDWIVKDGVSLTECCVKLNEQGVLTRRGSRWTPPNLSQILSKKDSLTGTIVCNRWNYKSKGIKNGKLSFRRLEDRPEDEWIRVKAPAIFTNAEYRELRKAIKANKTEGGKRKVDEFILRKLCVCGLCGKTLRCTQVGNFGKKPIRYYVCSNRLMPKKLMEGERCKAPWVNAWALEFLVVSRFMVDIWSDPKKTLKEWNQLGHKKTLINSLEKEIKSIDNKIDAKKTAKTRLLKKFATDMWTEEEIENEMMSVKKTINSLEKEKNAIEKQLMGYLKMQKNAETIDESLETLKHMKDPIEKILGTMPVTEGAKLLRHFLQDSKIKIYPREKPCRTNFGNRRFKPIKLSFDFKIEGKLDLTRIINVLKTFQATGKVPIHYHVVNHISRYNKQHDNRIIPFNIYGPLRIRESYR